MRFGTWEIILLIVLALLLFGGAKLAGIGKALGTSIKEFKKEVKDDSKSTKGAVPDAAVTEGAPLKERPEANDSNNKG